MQQEYDWIKKIREKDFVVMLHNPEKSSPQVDRFIQGVFAEWEPMPMWLVDALAAQNETRKYFSCLIAFVDVFVAPK